MKRRPWLAERRALTIYNCGYEAEADMPNI
jgi:hypothetical protein